MALQLSPRTAGLRWIPGCEYVLPLSLGQPLLRDQGEPRGGPCCYLSR